MNTAAGGNAPAASAWLPPGIPALLGEYRLIRPLGRGGIGAVFEGRHRLLEQRAAVKVLHPRHAADPHFAARFRREMAAFGRVPDHPNVVRAQYAGEEAGVLFLVMDYVAGADLNRVLLRSGSLPVPAACEAVRQALVGLEAIHRAGLIHRDLKPANLMLTAGGAVKVLDLGLARLRAPDGGDELTPSHAMMGTFDYLAPEQAADARRVDIRADIYSLGCTLYKLVSGSAPFGDRSTAGEKLRAHATDPFPSLPPGVPEGLDAVLARMTAKNPDDRFATPAEASEALAPFAEVSALAALADETEETPTWAGAAGDTPATIDRTQTPLNTTVVLPRRIHPWRAAALVALVVAAGAGAAAYVATRGDTPAGEPSARDTGSPPAAQPLVAPPAPAPAKPVDVLPPGTPPRNLSVLAPFDYHDLLDRPPVEAVWNPAGGFSSRAFDPRKHQLQVDAHREAMFHLGTLRRPSYTLQVQIRQSDWRSGVGVYFGYRPSTNPAAPGHVFQYVTFLERSDKNGKPIVCLSRGRGRVSTLPDGRPWVLLQGKMDEPVARPVQVCILTLEVMNRKLTAVRLNGAREVNQLVTGDTARQFSPADCDGELGLLVEASSCVFTEARLKITEDR